MSTKSAWKTGAYKKDEISNKVYITTLTKVSTIGKYHIFKMDNGDQSVVVFNDQPEILEVIQKNEGSVFAIRWFLKANSKFEYDIVTSVGTIKARTVAGVMVLAHKTSDRDRVILSTDTGLIILD